MYRRELLGLCASAFLSSAASKDSAALVGTPEKRSEYLKRMLRAFCTDIGPRPAGSREFDAGALLIEREMRRALPVVARDSFRFRRWVPASLPEFWVDGRRLETYLAEDSPGTPAQGIQGKLRKGGGAL